MKHTTSAALPLAARFNAWRSRNRAASLGALSLVSLSTLRAVESAETQDAQTRISETVRERATDDSTADADSVTLPPSIAPEIDSAPELSLCLSRGEREAIETVRPGSRGVIFRSPAPAPVDASEPLPSDFTPAAIETRESLFVSLSPEELAAIDAETRAELAAIEEQEKEDARKALACSFVSEWQPRFFPVDFAPRVTGWKAPAATLAAVVPFPVASPAPVAVDSDAEALRLAVLSLSSPRRRRA